jgi:hypothetical protein
MNFENTKVWGFEHAIRGMRNPKNSWDKSDSSYSGINAKIGDADLKLMQALIKAGSEHRKFMRQIFVSVDITAPMYWWSEFDTYKVSTVANSTSKMHKLASTPITFDCFEHDDFENTDTGNSDFSDAKKIWDSLIKTMESLRCRFNETKEKKYWKELIRILPESWLQKRTVTMNYENLLGMCSNGQRRHHKLNEWSGEDNPSLKNFIAWARTLPYAEELIFQKTRMEELAEENAELKKRLSELSK